MSTKITDETRAEEKDLETLATSRSRRWLPLGIVAVLAVALLLFFMLRNRTGKSEATETPAATNSSTSFRCRGP